MPLLALVVALLSSVSDANPKTLPTAEFRQPIRLWVGGMSVALREFEVDLFEQALTRTEDKYPPYELTLLNRPMSAQRSKIETERGTNVHAHFTSTWYGEFVNSGNVRLLHYPYFQNKLGLRKCLTRKPYLPRFESIHTAEDVKQLRLGQERSWIDVEIYARNGATVVKAAGFDNLFKMMSRDRFDCLPLSVLEIDRVQKEQLDTYPDLVIVPDLYIFYPIPVYLSVSRFQQGLADRLDEGLNQLFIEGSALRLFNEYYKHTDMHLNAANPRLVIFENPLIAKEQSDSVITQFLASIKTTPLPASPLEQATIPSAVVVDDQH